MCKIKFKRKLLIFVLKMLSSSQDHPRSLISTFAFRFFGNQTDRLPRNGISFL